jgi:hypothetical protein
MLIEKITIEFLNEIGACKEGVARWQEKGLPDVIPELRSLIADDCEVWANWFITRCMSHDQQIRYAVYAAELVIKIYEDKYPGDDRPRKAIEATKEYLKEKSVKNRNAAATAAANAASNAYATAAAANANAGNAYAAAAATAAGNAYAAAYAAAAAANAAAYAAAAGNAYAANAYAAAAAANAYAATANAKKELQIKILEYGIKLLEEDKNGV